MEAGMTNQSTSTDGPGCVTCHDEHPNSPRRDHNVGDVMGGIITLPIDTP
jgi:hypothetical protein